MKQTKLKIFFILLTTAALAMSTAAFRTKGNEWPLVATIKTSPVKKVSIDPYSNFYIADDRGNVFKFDSVGRQVLQFSPPKKANVTILEAWRTVNIFLFYRDLQEYTILDRFLTTSTPNSTFRGQNDLDEKRIGFARIANLSSDNNLWVFDDEDFSLKKLNTRTNQVVMHTPLNLILDPQFYELTYMREYQNLLFINDKNSGLLVFDNLGNYKTKIPHEGVVYFNFLGNNLYFISNDHLVTFDIYTARQQSIPLPQNKKYQYALMGNEKIYLFSSDHVEIYNHDIFRE